MASRTGYRITNNVIHTATGYPCMHLGDTRNGAVTHDVCRNGADPRLRRQSERGQPEHGHSRDNGAAHRCVGVLGLHHRSQPDRDLHRRERALRLRDRVSQGHRLRRHRRRPERLRRHPAPATRRRRRTPPHPTPGITSGLAEATTSTSAVVRLHRDRVRRDLPVQAQAGAYAACASPKAYSGLSTGSHRFSVRATDAAGNSDASPATKTWTVQSASLRPRATTSPWQPRRQPTLADRRRGRLLRRLQRDLCGHAVHLRLAGRRP